MNDYPLTDSIEEIHDRQLDNDAEVILKADAEAILVTARSWLTGYEIDECEKAAGRNPLIRDADMKCINRLRILFSREISSHHNQSPHN